MKPIVDCGKEQLEGVRLRKSKENTQAKKNKQNKTDKQTWKQQR